ncbi:MAG TPA: bile acid:sodium symporter [Ktedonobacteraceae bacterium]|nr:bile acid:sodium symporter [Ktedonobacteraceae bacterium]
MAVLHIINSAFLVIMLWATSLGLGMQFTLQQILAPFKCIGLMSIAVVLNVVVVPLIGWGLTRAFSINQGYAIGIMLVAFASAAPASLKLAQIERGNVPYAVSLVVLLSLLNIVAIPFWSALLMPSGVNINPLQVASTLLINVLLPLAIGLFIHARYEEQAREWAPPLNKLSTLALLIVIVSSIVVDFSTLLTLIGSFAILAGILLVLIAFVLGYFLGGSDQASRRVTGTVTGSRAVGPALLIATQSFPTDPQVTAGVIAVGLIGSLLPAIVAMEWGKRSSMEQKVVVPASG